MSQKSNLAIFQNARLYSLNADQNVTIKIVTLNEILYYSCCSIPELFLYPLPCFNYLQKCEFCSQLCGYLWSVCILFSVFPTSENLKKSVLEFRRKSLDLKVDCQWYITDTKQYSHVISIHL